MLPHSDQTAAQATSSVALEFIALPTRNTDHNYTGGDCRAAQTLSESTMVHDAVGTSGSTWNQNGSEGLRIRCVTNKIPTKFQTCEVKMMCRELANGKM